MLTFELSAIDLILAIAVIILLILQLTSTSGNIFDQIFSRKKKKQTNYEGHALKPQSKYTECPRGFGNIKKLSPDNSVSDRCLGCYQIMECYTEQNGV